MLSTLAFAVAAAAPPASLNATAAAILSPPPANAQGTPGSAIWTQVIGLPTSKPVSHPTTWPLMLVSTTRFLRAVSSEDGQVKWIFDTSCYMDVMTEPVFSNDGKTVYVGCGTKLFSIDMGKGRENWVYTTANKIQEPPMVSPLGSSIYVAASDGIMYAISGP